MGRGDCGGAPARLMCQRTPAGFIENDPSARMAHDGVGRAQVDPEAAIQQPAPDAHCLHFRAPIGH